MCFGWMLAAAAAILLSTAEANGQSAPQNRRTYAVQVEGLTAQDRDAVTRSLAIEPGLKLVFACVPAGLLVFEATEGGTRAMAKDRSLPLMRARIPSARITEVDHGLQEAEEACAQQRNR